jgi:hypothetical protein
MRRKFMRRKFMRRKLWRWAPAMVALALASMTVPNALGQCGLPNKSVKPANWSSSHIAGARVVPAALQRSDDDDDGIPSIVGMWHVIFSAQTLNGTPVDMVIDNAIAVWHKDGTEIMNSSRPAQDGNICLGVWAKTGKSKYHLNHIPWGGNDPTNAPGGIGNPQGGVQLTEHVTLSPDGNSYSGTFTLTAYTTNGQPTVTFTGVLAAKRITPSTSITSLF